ncbi:MAG: sigma-70 family RNA polymerase sigma factor [Ruminococcus sp.]|jgi:RNA polymerase sporulation-specific sigma factor|nr:sigma-70 family RNA polymerase sigma factor [Ruminococcus sp.]
MLNVSDVRPTDEEIIAGTENAAEIICERYMKYVASICKRFCSPLSPQFDDLLGESMVALFSAVHSFDPSKGAKFKTYAYACIQNRLATALKAAPPAVDIDTIEPIDHVSPETLFIQKESDKSLFTALDEILSDLEFSVLSLRLDGYSFTDIAKKLGITDKSVDNAMSRIRAKTSRS